MPASSKAQQRFFGVVKSMQKGDKPKKGEAGKIAKQMSKKDVDKYASTKHKGKPEKVKKEMKVKELIKKMVREIMAEDFAGSYPKSMRKSFNKKRQKQSEVLGYKLTGKSDIKTEIDDATVTEASLGDKFMKNIERYQDKIRKEREAYRKAKELQKKRNENMKEADMETEKIPGDLKIFMDKFIDKLKDKKLTRNKQKSILYKVVKGLGVSPQELMRYVQKVKKGLK